MKNTFVKVLSFMMALMMVVGMFSVVTFATEEGHVCAPSGEPIEKVPATCEKIGYNKYLCECGKEVIADVVPANAGHNYVKFPAKAPTCTEEGNNEGWACADCGDTDDLPEGKVALVTIEKVDHKWGTYLVKVDKTCTTNAFTTTQCVVCDALNIAEADYELGTAGHDYEYEVVDEADACTSGKVIVTCSSCDFKEEIIQTEDHNWVAMESEEDTQNETALQKWYVAGTECKYQWSEGWYCSDCWIIDTTRTVINETNGHIKDRLATDDDVDDEHDIIVTLTNDNLTAKIAAKINPTTGTNFKVGDKTFVANTCTTDGWYLIYCSDCDSYQIETVARHEGGHVPGDWTDWTENSADVSKTFPANTKAEVIETSNWHYVVFKQTQSCTRPTCGQVINTRTTTATTCNYENLEEGDQYTKVVAPTCYANGYSVFDCRYCDKAPVEGDYVVAKGEHSFEVEGATPTYVKVNGYNCASNANLITTCTNPECDTRSEAARIAGGDKVPATKTIADPNKDADHNYIDVEVKANCMVPNYYIKSCTICGATTASTKVMAGAAVDSTKHVAAYTISATYTGIANYKDKNGTEHASATTTTLASAQALTCTTNKIDYFLCACGERVTLTTAIAPGHAWVTGGNNEDNGAVAVYHYNHETGACNNKCKNFEPVTPTCVSGGQAAGGKLCVECGEVAINAQALGVDAKNHFEGKPTDPNKITTNAPTCKDFGTYTWNCTKCFVKVTETIVYTSGEHAGEAYKNPANHSNLVTKNKVDPSCIYAGMEAHSFCDGCNKYYDANGQETTAADLVIPGAEKHTWVAVELQYESCEENGWDAFKYCSVCQGDDLADDYTDVKVVTKDNGVTWTTDDPATKKAGQNEAYNAIKKNKHGLNYTKNWSSLIKYEKVNGEDVMVLADCANGAWVYIPAGVCCLYCDLNASRTLKDGKYVGTTQSAVDGYWEPALAHGNGTAFRPVQLENYVDVNGTLVPVDCTKESFVRYECEDCHAQKMGSYRPDKAHDFPEANNKGEYPAGAVKEDPASCITAGSKYLECDDCKQTKELEVLPATGHSYNGEPISFACKDLGKFEGLTCDDCHYTVDVDATYPDGTPVVKHNPVSVTVEETCTTDGYVVTYCLDCDKEYSDLNVYIPHKGHDAGYQSQKVMVSETTSAYIYRCHVCGEDYSVAKEVETPADIAIVLDYFNAIEEAGKKFTDSSMIAITVALKAENIGASAINLKLAYSENLEFVGKEFATRHGFTLFQDAVPNDVDQILDKDGNETQADQVDYVSISAATDFAEDKAPVDYVINGTVEFVTLYFTVNNAEAESGDDVWVEVIDADIVNDTQKELTIANNKKVDIKVAMYMDYNGNGAVTMADMLAAIQIFSGALTDEYDVTLDVDMDGDITYTDLLAIQDYINGKLSYDEIVALGSAA